MELEKNQKPAQKKTKVPAGVQELIDIGIPLKNVIFLEPVLSYKREPENAFYSPLSEGRQAKPSRTGSIWYTPHGVVVEQHGMYKIIPLSNVKDTDVL